PEAPHARHAEAHLEEAAEGIRLALKVLPQVPHHVLGVIEGRQHVNKSKELQPGVAVAHGPLQELPGPALGPEKRPGFVLDPVKQFTPDALGFPFDSLQVKARSRLRHGSSSFETARSACTASVFCRPRPHAFGLLGLGPAGFRLDGAAQRAFRLTRRSRRRPSTLCPKTGPSSPPAYGPARGASPLGRQRPARPCSPPSAAGRKG